MPCVPLVRMVFSAQLARLGFHAHWSVPTLFYFIYLRVYWIIYRGLGFLAVVSFGPPPPPGSLVSKLEWRHTGRLRKIGNLLTGGEGGWGRRQIIGRRESRFFYKSFNTSDLIYPLHSRCVDPSTTSPARLVRYYYSTCILLSHIAPLPFSLAKACQLAARSQQTCTYINVWHDPDIENAETTEAEGRRELTQHGVLPA